jgi:hypothetical protein
MTRLTLLSVGLSMFVELSQEAVSWFTVGLEMESCGAAMIGEVRTGGSRDARPVADWI